MEAEKKTKRGITTALNLTVTKDGSILSRYKK